MREINYLFSNKKINTAILSMAAAAALVVGWLAMAVNASSVVGVTSNAAEAAASGGSLVVTVKAQNDGDVEWLEVDSTNSAVPDFRLYADASNPYGTDGAMFTAAGATVTYNETTNTWVMNFGQVLTDAIKATNNGEMILHMALRDVDGNLLWGDMNNVSPSYRLTFDLVDGTVSTIIPEVTEDDAEVPPTDEDVVVPGVPNTGSVQ